MPKRIGLSVTCHKRTQSKEVIRLLNRNGQGVSYDEVQAIALPGPCSRSIRITLFFHLTCLGNIHTCSSRQLEYSHRCCDWGAFRHCQFSSFSKQKQNFVEGIRQPRKVCKTFTFERPKTIINI